MAARAGKMISTTVSILTINYLVITIDVNSRPRAWLGIFLPDLTGSPTVS
jgi:hypothetical protein